MLWKSKAGNYFLHKDVPEGIKMRHSTYKHTFGGTYHNKSYRVRILIALIIQIVSICNFIIIEISHNTFMASDQNLKMTFNFFSKKKFKYNIKKTILRILKFNYFGNLMVKIASRHRFQHPKIYKKYLVWFWIKKKFF